jgi:acetyl-CoA carboxylase biotin carboxyl carrier protein
MPNRELEITAEVTGRVVRVEAQVGARVAKEDVLLVLESMKMEIPVEAPDTGVVIELRVQEGESVAEGDSLVIMEA